MRITLATFLVLALAAACTDTPVQPGRPAADHPADAADHVGRRGSGLAVH